MKELQQFTALIESSLKKLQFPDQPANLYDPLRYFLQLGGKRIRPVLTLLGAEAFGTSAQQALPAALSVELFHNFSLIHDDIMDEAPLRRGKSTIHQQWNRDIAILSGDVLLVEAYRELCKQEAKHLPDLMEVFNRMAKEVCEGQQQDMDFESIEEVDKATYIEMIRLKTSVLLGAALEMGAIIANASSEQRKQIYQFGVSTGIAFQIQDDLLDLYADPDKFGKQIGGDLLANKKTILLIEALELASPNQQVIIRKAMKLENDTQKIAELTEVFNSLGLREAVVQLRDQYFGDALRALKLTGISESAAEPLIQLLEFLKNREV